MKLHQNWVKLGKVTLFNTKIRPKAATAGQYFNNANMVPNLHLINDGLIGVALHSLKFNLCYLGTLESNLKKI
jgi:hypothetical protein